MKGFKRQRSNTQQSARDRSYSPKPQQYGSSNMNNHSRFSNGNKSEVSIHSQHLWNTLQQLDLFPVELAELLTNQDRNISNFKKSIQKQKQRVTTDMQNFKRQFIHYLDDFKLSTMAQLDAVYKHYMQKYAKLKGQVLQTKRLRDQIQMQMTSRSNISTLYNISNVNKSNGNVIKALETGAKDIKKFHILNYVNQLQKNKFMPLSQLGKQLTILTQYDNGFYLSKQLDNLLTDLRQKIKAQLRNLYNNKQIYIRPLSHLLHRDQQQSKSFFVQDKDKDKNSREIDVNYQPVSHDNFTHQQNHLHMNNMSSNMGNNMKKNKNIIRNMVVSPSQQIAPFQWLQQPKFNHEFSIQPHISQIILCAIIVRNDQIAIGSKGGSLSIYSIQSNRKIKQLEGHKASICSLALVKFQGVQYLASGSDFGCSCIILWDTNSWVIRQKLQGHKAAVTSIVDLLDDQHIVSGSYDKRINIYNLRQNKVDYNLPTNKSSIIGIILNSNVTKMISCGLDNSLNVWQIVRNKFDMKVQTIFLQRIIQNNTMICSLSGSVLRDDIIYIGTKDGKVKIINIQKGQSFKSISIANTQIIQMVIFERQSKINYPIIVAWPSKQQNFKVVNTETGKVNNVQTRGYIEFGCGIGPKGLLLKKGLLGMVSQSQMKKQISFYSIQNQV